MTRQRREMGGFRVWIRLLCAQNEKALNLRRKVGWESRKRADCLLVAQWNKISMSIDEIRPIDRGWCTAPEKLVVSGRHSIRQRFGTEIRWHETNRTIAQAGGLRSAVSTTSYVDAGAGNFNKIAR